MVPLTKIQQRIYDFVGSQLANGKPCPSQREIAAKFGYRSPKAAKDHIDALIRKGWLVQAFGKARSLRLVQEISRERIVDIPIFGSIPAGLGEDREQQKDGCVSVDIKTIGFTPGRNTFALRVQGDSMIGKHICDGDIVIMEHGADARPGQIVAAYIDGKSTLKTYLVKDRKPFLKAENPKYPNLIPAEELMIQGIFRCLIRRANG